MSAYFADTWLARMGSLIQFRTLPGGHGVLTRGIGIVSPHFKSKDFFGLQNVGQHESSSTNYKALACGAYPAFS